MLSKELYYRFNDVEYRCVIPIFPIGFCEGLKRRSKKQAKKLHEKSHILRAMIIGFHCQQVGRRGGLDVQRQLPPPEISPGRRQDRTRLRGA